MTKDYWTTKSEKWLEIFDHIVRHRVRHYRTTFNVKDASDVAVLKDLAKYCRANESCFDPDPRIHAVAEGRREVWLRIQQHLNLEPEVLTDLIIGRNKE